MYKTFNGWKLAGRVVAAGERSNLRNEYGDKLFHTSQTVIRGSSTYIERDVYGRRIRKTTTYSYY